MTDSDRDEAGYLCQEQARFRFYKKIEERQADSEKAAGAPSADPYVDSREPEKRTSEFAGLRKR